MVLKGISDRYFEVIGSIMGLVTLVGMGVQVFTEYTATGPSTMSLIYVTLLILNFSFWTFYGLRFRLVAISVVNGGAVVLQAALLAVILFK